MDICIQGNLSDIHVNTSFVECPFSYTGADGGHHFTCTPGHRVDIVLMRIRNTFGSTLTVREALDRLLARDGLGPATWTDRSSNTRSDTQETSAQQ